MRNRVIAERRETKWQRMKARNIIRKLLNITNTPLVIIRRRRSTMRPGPTKRQAIMLIWPTDTICSLPNMLKQRRSIKLNTTTSTELTGGAHRCTGG